MTQVKTRKQRVMFTVEQKLDYVKLMIKEHNTHPKPLLIIAVKTTLLKVWVERVIVGITL